MDISAGFDELNATGSETMFGRKSPPSPTGGTGSDFVLNNNVDVPRKSVSASSLIGSSAADTSFGSNVSANPQDGCIVLGHKAEKGHRYVGGGEVRWGRGGAWGQGRTWGTEGHRCVSGGGGGAGQEGLGGLGGGGQSRVQVHRWEVGTGGVGPLADVGAERGTGVRAGRMSSMATSC